MMPSLFDRPALTVTELCQRLRSALRGQFPTSVRVVGEVSKCRSVDGHVYFSLKDRNGYVECVSFRTNVEKMHVKLPLRDGVAIEVCGFVEIYEPKSQYQLRVTDIKLVGIGALYIAFEELKAKLEGEGLFAAQRKRPLPTFIRRVAVVTSRHGAALQDFITTCRRRGAHVSISVCHAPVQGAAAAPALAKAITKAGRLPVDVVVVTRGGGTIEDLWAFNTQEVALAIADCARPVLSAVGHQTDVTIADFVADKSVATPTAAAEFVAREREALLERIAADELRLRRSLVRLVSQPRGALARARIVLRRAAISIFQNRTQRVNDLAVRLSRRSPRRQIEMWHKRLDVSRARLRVLGPRAVQFSKSLAQSLTQSLRLDFERCMQSYGGRLKVAAVKLASIAPQRTLQRGYAIAYDAQGNVLTDSGRVRIGENINVELKSGRLGATVRERSKDGKNGKGSIEG